MKQMTLLRRWLTDTLAKRLFLLMWAALVVSHMAAFAVVHYLHLPGDAGMPGGGHTPTFPSLPPMQGMPPPPDALNEPGPDFSSAPDMPPPGHVPSPSSSPGLPAQALVLDYGIRLLVIALAAWWGSRWLARPMRHLVSASSSLQHALARDADLPVLDEQQGTQEVREAAQVFNDMARRLREQFKARGLMVAAISHDLRTPLTRLRIRLESMDADPKLQARSVADIHEMNELIDTVLTVFRGDAFGVAEPLQDTDVGSLVQSLIDDLAEQGQAVRLAADHQAQTSTVVPVHPAALRRVIGNLLTNALRYAGSAEVSVLASNPHQVRIVVADRGPGIPPAQLEAVFQPFYRLESSRNRDTGGAGLGLYIARELMQRQGGQLTLANRPGGGLSAEVLLPSQQAQAQIRGAASAV